MKTNRRKLTAALLLIGLVVLTVAGTKVSKLTRTSSLSSSNDVVVVVTGATVKATRQMQAHDLARGLGPWITNGSLAALSSVSYVSAGANLTSVKTAAAAGTTIMVGPGHYVDHNLWKPGVSWEYIGDAKVCWTNVSDGIGIYDDRLISGGGAGTNYIKGGSFIYESDTGADTAVNGPFVFTNANTIAYVDINRVEFQCYDTRVFGAGCFVVKNCRQAFLRATHITDQGTIPSDSYAAAIYWEQGLTTLDFETAIMDTGYGVWCQEPVGLPATDLYVGGKFLSLVAGVSIPNCVRFTGTNSQYRTWIDIGEIRNQSGDTPAVGMDGAGGRLYMKGQKMGSATAAFQIGAGTFWGEFDKVSAATAPWVRATNCESFWAVREWEDAATNILVGFELNGGLNNFGPGLARVGNGRGVVHKGGTNRFTGMIIDTRGTNTLTSVTNNRPVTLYDGTSNLVLNACILLSPIGTANGGAYSLFTTNAAAFSAVVYNGVTMNSNYNNSTPYNVAAVYTNVSQLR